jgi:membrane associated rhomboid family serine protease
MIFTLTPAVRAVLLANLALFFAAWYLGADRCAPLELWPVGQDVGYAGLPFMPWQLVTYGFLHFEFWHLFTNMLGLLVFGPAVERLLGSRRFHAFYFTCVIGAGLSQLLVGATIAPAPAPTVGASGGIFGLLLCYAMNWPRQRIMLLFPPIPMPAWLFVTGYGLFELYEGVFGRNEGVAHFAHLGGMAAGFVLLQAWRVLDRRRGFS